MMDASWDQFEDSWMLEIAVVDVEHLESVVSRCRVPAVTSTSIILKALRELHPLRPAAAAASRPTASVSP